MHPEVPEFRRCCFCVPLRYGLLGWAYLKLVLSLVNMGILLFLLQILFIMPAIVSFLLFFALLVCFADIGFIIVFIVGAHKKNYKLIRIYYYYAMVALGACSVLFSMFFGMQLYSYFHVDHPEFQARLIKSMIEGSVIFGLQVVLQGYLLLLIRSEFLKLKRHCKFEFVNNAVDAETSQCHLDLTNDVTTKGMQAIP